MTRTVDTGWLVVWLAALALVPAMGRGAEPSEEEVIDVTASRLGEIAGPGAERLRVIERQELETWSGENLGDLLARVAPLDVRRRGPAQADVWINGAGFEQVLVLIDGVPVNDPQTGHHNLDLPLTADDIERIEIRSGAGSATWGPGAVGGVIQVITRYGLEPNQAWRAATGSFGATRASASLAGRSADDPSPWVVSGRASVGLDRSDGHRPGTESQLLTLTAGTALLHPGGITRLRVAWTDRRFGADGFYGPWPATEHTSGLLALATAEFAAGERLQILPRVSLRRHSDHFVLDRERPEWFVADHTSQAVGAELALRFTDTLVGALAMGLEGEWQQLESSLLDSHRRLRAGLFAEQADSLSAWFDWNLGARLDFGQTDLDVGFVFFSPRLAVRLKPVDGFWLVATAGRGFRLPSFTELYYDSPSNRGDPDLPAERSWAGDLSVRFQPVAGLGVRLAGFVRWDSNLVEWVRPSAEAAWRAVGTGELLAAGPEAEIVWRPLDSIDLRCGYARLFLDRDPPPGEAKYVFRQPLDDAWLGATARLPWAFELVASARYRRRSGSLGELWIDLRLARTLGPARVWLQGANLLDQRIEEVPGAALPGLSVMAGVDLVLAPGH